MITVVIPAYNEENLVEQATKQTHDVLKDAFDDFTVSIVDNGSSDATFQIAQELEQTYDAVEAHRASSNGKASAIRYGWEHADTPILGFVDSDLSPDISILPAMTRRVEETKGMAITSRHHPTSKITWSKRRRLTSHLYNVLLQILAGSSVTDHQCGLKCIHREFYNAISQLRSTEWFLDTELILQAHHQGRHIDEYAISWEDREANTLFTPSVSYKLLHSLFSFYRHEGFTRHGATIKTHERDNDTAPSRI